MTQIAIVTMGSLALSPNSLSIEITELGSKDLLDTEYHLIVDEEQGLWGLAQNKISSLLPIGGQILQSENGPGVAVLDLENKDHQAELSESITDRVHHYLKLYAEYLSSKD